MSCGCGCNCGCCTGTVVTTPAEIYNRPGLDAIDYRIGEHGSFLESMLARLSSSDFQALTGLTARTTDDPSIALLDGWATVADVLTFYQERIANEGYLRTATERRSVLEMARLIGYEPRPGVSASVYLAYTVDDNATDPVQIPLGSKAQSIPGPDELPQAFETSAPFLARKEWNAIKPRLLRPQTARSILEGSDERPGAGVFLKGISLNLKPNDALLLASGDERPKPFRVATVEENATGNYTYVGLAAWLPSETLFISGLTQIRRALLRLRAAEDLLAGTSAFVTDLLILSQDFLTWLYQQATADDPDPDVEAVVRRPPLVATILAPFDQLREAVLSPASEKALGKSVNSSASDISELSGIIAELIDVSGGGPVGASTDRVAAILKDKAKAAGTDSAEVRQEARLIELTRSVVRKLAVSPSVPPRNTQSLQRSPAVLFEVQSDVGSRLVAALQPSLAATLDTATSNLQAAPENTIRAWVLRQKSLLFGATAPKKVTSVNQDTGVATTVEWSDADIVAAEDTDAVHLDSVYDKAKPGSWIMLDFSGLRGAPLGSLKLKSNLLVAKLGELDAKTARAAYGFSGQTTRLGLVNIDGSSQDWFSHSSGATPAPVEAFPLIRRATAYFESEELKLGEEVIATPICGDDWIETDSLIPGLESGRWLVVSGERADISGSSGVSAGELVMLEAARQYIEKLNPGADTDPNAANTTTAKRDPSSTFLPGDRVHTYLKLARPLNYCYKRDTLAINANVVQATHGETRIETLGAGDSAQTLQTFALRQPPLTFVSSPNPSGVSSTLQMYVNNVEWHEATALLDLGPNDRGFVSSTNDDGITSITFGNGVMGARLPTGLENVKAIYRSGIGASGNVKTGQISQLMSRPLGIKAVSNPIGASGGADRETRDQARSNAPLAVRSLDRLVSTGDYADFARTFAGIGKAVSARLDDHGVESVFVTIAGAGDIPIDKTSDLYANLIAALRDYGDPYQPFRVDTRILLLLVLSARVAISPDYLWDDVSDRIRAALLDHFSFERRDLAQGVALSEVIAAIQSVPGVTWVDVDALGAVSQTATDGGLRAPQEIAAAAKKVFADAETQGRPDPAVKVRGIWRSPSGEVLPAEIAFFVPTVPETLLLSQIEA